MTDLVTRQRGSLAWVVSGQGVSTIKAPAVLKHHVGAELRAMRDRGELLNGEAFNARTVDGIYMVDFVRARPPVNRAARRVRLACAWALLTVAALVLLWVSRYVILAAAGTTLTALLLVWLGGKTLAGHSAACPGFHCPGCPGR